MRKEGEVWEGGNERREIIEERGRVREIAFESRSIED